MRCPIRTTDAARCAVLSLSLVALLGARVARAEEPALTGTWGIERVVRSSYTLPLIGLVVNTQTTRALWRFEQDGKVVRIHERLCGLRTKTSEPGVGATMRPGFNKAASGKYLTAALGRDGGQVTFSASGSHVIGAKLAATSPLPVTPDDPSVVDVDGDGKPGFTVTLKGAVPGEIQFVRRERLSYKGTLSTTELSGTVGLEIEQIPIAATNPLLLIPLPETIEQAHFHGLRLADGAACKAVFALSDL